MSSCDVIHWHNCVFIVVLLLSQYKVLWNNYNLKLAVWYGIYFMAVAIVTWYNMWIFHVMMSIIQVTGSSCKAWHCVPLFYRPPSSPPVIFDTLFSYLNWVYIFILVGDYHGHFNLHCCPNSVFPWVAAAGHWTYSCNVCYRHKSTLFPLTATGHNTMSGCTKNQFTSFFPVSMSVKPHSTALIPYLTMYCDLHWTRWDG